jgi:hypothetical protein
VLPSAQEYARLKRRDRRIIAAGELSERQVDAIRNARVPDQYADLVPPRFFAQVRDKFLERDRHKENWQSCPDWCCHPQSARVARLQSGELRG